VIDEPTEIVEENDPVPVSRQINRRQIVRSEDIVRPEISIEPVDQEQPTTKSIERPSINVPKLDMAVDDATSE
jgi:hypothetical protein